MKTKVVAFRVTQEEYDGLAFNAGCRKMKVSDFVIACLRQDLDLSVQALQHEQKRLQAKAKRDAKKATANAE
jgi:uncharacterized protein (DUF1778 family)